MSSYTASGARRTGDEYQDLMSAEVLLDWLEHPEQYKWARLEAMKGSLDDIQMERADGTLRLLQVKFAVDAFDQWDWDHLTKQESGKDGRLKQSLLQKWKASLDAALASGATVSEAALITNRKAGPAISSHLSVSGIVKFEGLSEPLQSKIASQLDGQESASKFFASFQFHFKEPSIDTLEIALRQRFRRLGGTGEGWASLIRHIRRWINHRDEPSEGGYISLSDIRRAALWHLPPQIPQGFVVPEDYVAPKAWSTSVVEPAIRHGGAPVVVTGSPGVGKSTYLSWLVDELRGEGVPVVRHHYFLSTTDPTPNRSDWETAADSIIGQLRSLYHDLIGPVDRENPLPGNLHHYLLEAGRHRIGKNPLVVIVDGLDHVWRETGHQEELRKLFDLMLPPSDGVVVVVGTQNVDISHLPKKLRDSCPRERWLEIPALGRSDVAQWLTHHKAEINLPSGQDQVDRILADLASAFHDVSGGHPLVLHYILQAAQEHGSVIQPERIRQHPIFDSNSSVAAYYRTLWESITPEGHLLLHLLAGFTWAWPRDGLVQCLAPQADHARLEKAERDIRHVLGCSPAGVTAFHESLLAHVRALPEHEVVTASLRHQVIEWLTHRAPDYWRWRYEWEERAKNGEHTPLIESATPDWAVESLASGRARTEVAKVVAASGWAALLQGCLGVATERHYIDAYLEEAGHSPEVLSILLWVALRGMDSRKRLLELDLFLSRQAQATSDELEVVSEVAFTAGQHQVCRALLKECGDRWNEVIRSRSYNETSSLKKTMSLMIAASLEDPSRGPYQRYLRENGEDPDWCPSGLYAQALARLCAIGDGTRAIREELRFLANQPGRVSYEAVDAVVRLACRDNFNPEGWITSPEARRSGLFRCYRMWVQRAAETPAEAPKEVSFETVWQARIGRNKAAFAELARAYFFSCMASVGEGRPPVQPVGLSVRADKVASFLSLLCDVAVEAAQLKNSGREVGGAWFLDRLSTVAPLRVPPNDYENDLLNKVTVARIVVSIAHDLDELHYAETGRTTLTVDVISAAVDGPWTWAEIWIEDRVDRRLRMGDYKAVRLLVDRERNRLTETRGYLQSRAVEYSTLAQFCQLHDLPTDEVSTLVRLAARNLMGHGFHKDMVLFDVLAAIRFAATGDKVRTLERLRLLSPIVQIVDEITDGDETNHLKGEFAAILGRVAPETLPPYLRALQRNHDHWEVESCLTDLARLGPLTSIYDKALAGTLVHEGALYALQKRAESGDTDADQVLASILSYCGRGPYEPLEGTSWQATPTSDSQKSSILVEDYPPEQLPLFVKALRDARIYGDDHLAAWTMYWRSSDPDGLLEAVTEYQALHGQPHEGQTGQVIVNLALERAGRQAAWDWLITYHNALFGWSSFAYRLTAIEWIWGTVRSTYSSKWLDFIYATSQPRWGSAGGAPSWGIERMVRFLHTVGRTDLAEDVLDAAVKWGAGLAADMLLPDHGLVADQPDLPVALSLLVDRLDCPSRMVQERAAWALAGLLCRVDLSEVTRQALLHWHEREPLELRTCTLLLILHLARTAYDLSEATCVDIIRQATIVPSIGADILLREFGDAGATFAASFNYRVRHSECPSSDFLATSDFPLTVQGHLARIFEIWANRLDTLGVAFSRQWEWEAAKLAAQQGLSLRLNGHFSHHYLGGTNEPSLAISDRLSTVLRSAYLRALHWAVAEAGLATDLAEIHARRVAIMADPVVWAIQPSQRPGWWPVDPGETNGLDMLAEAVALAVRNRLAQRDPNDEEILLYAAGPVGNRPHFDAELVIRGFLQSASGPLRPPHRELAAIPSVECRPVPPRLSLPGNYMCFGRDAFRVRDWVLAPLAWRFESDTQEWLLPERQHRGVYLPATWLLPGAPQVETASDEIRVRQGDQTVARYRYWYDDLHERHYSGACSRAGAEVVIRRESVQPFLSAGAALCWIVILRVAQREEYKNTFGEEQIVGAWVVGGSNIVWPKPWLPPSVG